MFLYILEVAKILLHESLKRTKKRVLKTRSYIYYTRSSWIQVIEVRGTGGRLIDECVNRERVADGLWESGAGDGQARRVGAWGGTGE